MGEEEHEQGKEEEKGKDEAMTVEERLDDMNKAGARREGGSPQHRAGSANQQLEPVTVMDGSRERRLGGRKMFWEMPRR